MARFNYPVTISLMMNSRDFLRVSKESFQQLDQLATRDLQRGRKHDTARLKDIQKFNRAQVQDAEKVARDEAAGFEKHLGAGFFRKLAGNASSAFRGGFSVGGIGGGGGLGGLIGGALSVAGGSLITSVLGGVKDKITGAITTGFDFNKVKEQALLGFEIKLKGKDEANVFFNRISDFAEKAPQELDQVIDSVEKMMVAFKPDQALYALDAITDAVAAQGKVGAEASEQINGIGLQLQQMLLKNKVSAEETTSLAERQVKVYEYLGNEIAKTDKNFAALTDTERISRVQELAQKGMLEARTAVAVILKGMKEEYGGTAERIAKETLAGIESNTADRLSRLTGTATEAAFERYKKLRQQFLDLLNSSTGDRAAGNISALTGDLFKAMDTAFDAVKSGNLKQLGLSAMTSAAGGIQQGAKSLYESAAAAAGQVEQGWRDRLEQHSPSQILFQLGYEAGLSLQQGFAQGLGRGKLGDAIKREAERVRLPPELLAAMIKQESGGNTRATSPKGARGVAQFMPGTARQYGLQVGDGIDERLDPDKSIRAMADHMRDLVNEFNGDIEKAVAAYNAGTKRVYQFGGVPPPSFARGETFNYTRSIMADYRRMMSGQGDPFAGMTGGVEGGGGLSSLTPKQQISLFNEIARRRHESEYTGEGRKGFDLPANVGEWTPEAKRMMSGGVIPVAVVNIQDLGRALNAGEARRGEFGVQSEDAWMRSAAAPVDASKIPDSTFDRARQMLNEAYARANEKVKEVDLSITDLVTVEPRALESIKQVADKTGDAFASLPPLIKKSSEASQQATAEVAKSISGILGDAFENAFTHPREAFKMLRQDFASMLLGMARDWFQSAIFKALNSGGGSSGGASGGGFIEAITGGIKKLFGLGGGSRTSTTPSLTGAPIPGLSFLGDSSNPIDTTFGRGFSAGLNGGASITPPASFSATTQTQHQFTELIKEAAGGSSAGGGASLAAFGSEFATAGPIGLAVMGAETLISSFSGSLSNTQALMGGGLLAFFINRNARRRKDETTRDALATDARSQVYALLGEAKAGNLTVSQARAQFEQIKNAYMSQVASSIRDSKTKKHAQLYWTQDLEPQLWPQIEKAAKAGEAAQAFKASFIPTFDKGGLVPFVQPPGQAFIKVRPGERFIYPHQMSPGSIVPGVDRGIDDTYTYAPIGTRVLTRQQQIQAFDEGGLVSPSTVAGRGRGGAASSVSPRQQPINLSISLGLSIGREDVTRMYVMGAASEDGREVNVEALRRHLGDEGMNGALGDIVLELFRRGLLKR